MTIKQQQCLLAYLDYYEGDIDGKWGPQSEQATKDFQSCYGLAVDGIFGTETEQMIRTVIFTGESQQDWWDSICYFTREEFACKCGQFCDGYPAEIRRQLVEAAEDVREYFDAPVIVSSGLRCTQHNANVGGVSNSRHLSGKAMDFRVKGKTSAEVLGYVQEHIGVRYAYAIDENYVHMDIE